MRPLRRLAWPLLLAVALVAPVRAATNGPAGRLDLPGLDGTRHALSSWQGRVIVLNFWATWCEPCLAEVPDLVALEDKYRAHGLSIVSVGIDEAGKLRNVVRTLGINYPVLVADPDGARPMLQAWGNRSGIIPYTVIIDRGGRVSATHRGPIHQDDLDDLIRPLLAGESGK